VQVNGAIGCLTRVPLPHQAFCLGQPPVSEEPASSEAGDLGGGSRWSKELWNPYLRDTALRVFASCGLSAQVNSWATWGGGGLVSAGGQMVAIDLR